MTEAEPTTMLEALRSDHRAIILALADPDALTNSADADALREQVVMDLVRHFVAEEQYLYPTIRKRILDGAQLADEGFHQDRAMESHLRKLENADLDDQSLAAAWGALRAAFVAHAERQEPEFEALAAACSAEELADLGDDILGAEQLAPTRPRILAPSSPAANKITSFVEGFLDKARDYYTKRGIDPDETVDPDED